MHLDARLPRETAREYAVRTLKENIISLELKPGTVLSENELAAEMRISRTPVREALLELSKVQIIEIYPQRGSIISYIDFKLVEESQFIRRALECEAVEVVCEIASDKNIAELKENIRLQIFYMSSTSGASKVFKLDNSFHKMLFDIAEKPNAYTLMRSIAIHFDRVRNIAMAELTPSVIVQEHAKIVEAIENRDPKQARAMMQLHLTNYRTVEKAFKERYPNYFK